MNLEDANRTLDQIDHLLAQFKQANKKPRSGWRLEYHEPTRQVHIEPLNNPTPFQSGWVTVGHYDTYKEATEAASRHKA